ncbi:heterodisulfide reductase subunit B [Bacteroides luti]|jgi:heterodisulfide reductase subunit B|uniref:Heterodisulfide reductase subunit B n=1 Tax=Bacteroides luti TaxID=1297750 RepID=A0A1M5A4J6_9BACE|nr:CoB--CoM heterodisulfide reductase iron-sulfur subunit B family protein [Bacteroides luti]SHF25144.1 heterodisulfide reductase subunit B [Bacteroides luti]
MKIGFYPGCSLKGSSREYNESVVAIAKALDIELVEIKDWNCCGATAAHSMNEELSLSLPARILALAEAQGLKEVVVPCAACYNRLMVTQHELKDNNKRERVTDIIKMPYSGDLKIINVLQMLETYAMDKIQEKVTKPFAHKVACYYGCLLIRPHKILQFDRVEDPQSMDAMVKLIGGTPISWAFKTECCGAGLSVSRTDLVAKLSGNILKDAAERDAKAIIVACPMCQSNLDMRRGAINETLSNPSDIPVIFITQAIGLALGLSPKELGLERHFVNVKL